MSAGALFCRVSFPESTKEGARVTHRSRNQAALALLDELEQNGQDKLRARG